MKEAEYNLVFFFSGIKRLSKYILLFHLFFIMFFSACGREQCGFKSSTGMSENADLKSIILSAGSLVPPFSPVVTTYTVDLPMNVESIIVTGIACHHSAEISNNNGSIQSLEAGSNIILLTVTAENNISIKDYLITVNRGKNEISFYTEILTKIIERFYIRPEIIKIVSLPVKYSRHFNKLIG